MTTELTSNVEALEAQAEKILSEARDRASQIILQGKEEARKILSSQLSLDEARAECERILSEARTEAGRKIEESQRKAAAIRAKADEKVGELTELVANIVRGRA